MLLTQDLGLGHWDQLPLDRSFDKAIFDLQTDEG